MRSHLWIEVSASALARWLVGVSSGVAGRCDLHAEGLAALGRGGGLGLAPVEGPCRPAAEPRRSRAGVSPDKQRSDRGGLLLPVRGYWPMRWYLLPARPLIGFFSVGDVEIFDRLWVGVRVHLWRPRHHDPATR
jgi:hypothetical protein